VTKHHSRGARREREAASALGTTRVLRKRGESAPDLDPVHLQNGMVLQPEVKNRAKLPRVVMLALEQAQSYRLDATPLVVVSQTGKPAIVCIALDAFSQIIGRSPVELPQQPSLPLKGRVAA
jgi:Holliday junction resolvase